MERKRKVPEVLKVPELPLDAPDLEAFQKESIRRINRALTAPIPFETEITNVAAPNAFPVRSTR